MPSKAACALSHQMIGVASATANGEAFTGLATCSNGIENFARFEVIGADVVTIKD